MLPPSQEPREETGPTLMCNLGTRFMASDPITSWQIDEETVTDFIWGAPKSLQMVTAAMKLEDACFLEEKL